MNFFRRTFLALAPLVAFSRLARAQGEQADEQLSSYQLANGWVLSVTPDGKIVKRGDVSGDLLQQVLKDAHPMPAGTVMIMRGKGLWVTPDRRMDSGTMLCQALERPAS